MDEFAKAVRGDEREQRGAEGDEDVRPQPCCLLVQLALETDHAAERGRDGEANERALPAERRETRHAAPPPPAAAQPLCARSRRTRDQAAPPARPARTARAPPLPAPRPAGRRRS